MEKKIVISPGMTVIRFVSLIAFFLFGLQQVLSAQNIIARQSHENGVYKKNEKIRATVFLNGSTDDSVLVTIWKDFSKQRIQKKLKYTGDTMVFFNETLHSPGSIIFEIHTKSDSASIGSIVQPDRFTPGTKRPKDFDEYWQEEKRKLRQLPMLVKAVPLKATDNGYVCQNVEINCTGPKPARGYFAKPASAKSASLPIVLFVHAAGIISASWVRSNPENALRYAKIGRGALSFDLNAHGMLNGQPDSYYDSLQHNDLKNYPYIGLGSKKDFYFRGMYLRLMPTLDFLTSQPEWDGKRILVIGESQGGGQALAAAGLDHRVTAVVATVPAMCDWGGTLAGRKGGWPDPFAKNQYNRQTLLSTLPYFDVAHILKYSKATLVVEMGLIDTTCPAAGIFAAVNQAAGRKILFIDTYRGHHASPSAYREVWQKTVNEPKNAFIEDYLK